MFCQRLVMAPFCLILVFGLAQAAEPVGEGKPPVIIDGNGKEITPTKWKIVQGIKRINWAGEPGKGLDVFEMREVGSTNLVEGILTLVPASRLQSIEYDTKAKTVAVKVLGAEKPLRGSIAFKGINAFVIEAEVKLGDGIADVKFRGGSLEGGVREIRFPEPVESEKPVAKKNSFTLTSLPDKKGDEPVHHAVNNLMALYRFPDKSEKRLPTLMFKKTHKIEIDKIDKMKSDFDLKTRSAECEVDNVDGTHLSLTWLSAIEVDGKTGTLIGLVGQSPAGYRLFPMGSITELRQGIFDQPDGKEKKAEPKKKDLKKDGPIRIDAE